jgi:type IV pilus assembly protein PilO
MKLSLRSATIIGIAILLVVSVAGWFLILAPRLAQAGEIAAQAEELAMSNLQLQNRYNQTLTQAESATQAASEAQALFSTMPEEADLPAVLTQIIEAATAAGITPTDISTISTTVPKTVARGKPSTNEGSPTSGVNLAQMEISMTVAGKHRQLLRFLTNLETLDRAMLVTSNELTTSVSTDATGRELRQEVLKITGSMFVLKSELPDLVATVEQLLKDAQTEAQGTPGSTNAVS